MSNYTERREMYHTLYYNVQVMYPLDIVASQPSARSRSKHIVSVYSLLNLRIWLVTFAELPLSSQEARSN